MIRSLWISGWVLAVAAVTLVSLAGAQASAQPNQGPANALQGFSTNRGKPVRIQAASLEVRDKEKVATFNGDVHVVTPVVRHWVLLLQWDAVNIAGFQVDA